MALRTAFAGLNLRISCAHREIKLCFTELRSEGDLNHGTSGKRSEQRRSFRTMRARSLQPIEVLIIPWGPGGAALNSSTAPGKSKLFRSAPPIPLQTGAGHWHGCFLLGRDVGRRPWGTKRIVTGVANLRRATAVASSKSTTQAP